MDETWWKQRRNIRKKSCERSDAGKVIKTEKKCEIKARWVEWWTKSDESKEEIWKKDECSVGRKTIKGKKNYKNYRGQQYQNKKKGSVVKAYTHLKRTRIEREQRRYRRQRISGSKRTDKDWQRNPSSLCDRNLWTLPQHLACQSPISSASQVHTLPHSLFSHLTVSQSVGESYRQSNLYAILSFCYIFQSLRLVSQSGSLSHIRTLHTLPQWFRKSLRALPFFSREYLCYLPFNCLFSFYPKSVIISCILPSISTSYYRKAPNECAPPSLGISPFSSYLTPTVFSKPVIQAVTQTNTRLSSLSSHSYIQQSII